MAFQLTSRAFKDGEMIPPHYTADGEDVSPPLEWKEPPPGTKSFALICDDPNAPGGTFIHWVVFNIPPNLFHFPEAYPVLKTQPNGTRQGTNDFGNIGCGGPAPPSGVHRYYFKIFAVSTVLEMAGGSKKAALERALQRRILGEAQLMGKYQRK